MVRKALSKRIHGVIRLMRLIADNGLPLKVTTQWTDDDYYERPDPETDQMTMVNVQGWLVMINGKKYPRPDVDGDGTEDWSYRYTPKVGHTESGKLIAIGNALKDAGLSVAHIKQWHLK